MKLITSHQRGRLLSRGLLLAFVFVGICRANAAAFTHDTIAGSCVAKREGMETARTALKADKVGFQWLAFSLPCDARWQRLFPATDYRSLFKTELVATWGGTPGCNLNLYPRSLWWGQYNPGGRVTSTHSVFFESALAAEAMEQDPDLAERQFETILRQSVKFAPYQSRAIVHPDIPAFVAAYKEGKVPACIARTERLAEHYGFPTLNLAKAAAEGGAEGVTNAVKAFVRTVLGKEATVGSNWVFKKLPPPLNAGVCDQCHIVSYEDGAVRKIGDWKIGVRSPNPSYMTTLAPGKAGDRLEVEFRGTEIGLVDFTCADGAAYAYRVDGGDWKDLPAEAAEPGHQVRERHLPLANGLRFSGAAVATDADRHTLEMKVVKAGKGTIVGFLLNGSTADEDAGAGRNPTTLPELDAVYAKMAKVSYVPPAGRHAFLPKTMARLANGPTLNIVALGDSIVADTCRSRFELLLGRNAPKCKVTCVCSVRGATGCTWYKDDNRVDGWVFSHKPDLVMIGGASNKDDTESVRSVVRQIRAKDPSMEILILTPVFGMEGNAKDFGWNVGWDADPEKAKHPFRRELRKMAAEEKCAFFDINAPWRAYCLASGLDMGYFHRDMVHANTRGSQLLGRLLETWFKPE